jgi:geranylgeranyl diphosphate synthase type II
MAPAVAIELVHAFSLVHDDLPALDNDDIRRGRPTVHRVYGEAMAVLVGDALLSIGVQVLADARPELVSELITANTSMIAGQVYDTLGGFAPEIVDEAERLELIHSNKTGALLVAACRMGARAGGASPAQLAAIATYGEVLGLMFQIVDDLLDVTQSAEHVGKATGKDLAANKLTFPGVLGVDRSREEVRQLNARAYAALEPLGSNGRMLRELADYMAVRTK